MKKDTADIFVANLRRMMASREEWSTANALSRASSGALNQTSISRWLNGDRRPSVEAVGLLAAIFRKRHPSFRAWMLLYDDLSPQKLPMCVGDDEREIVERVRRLIVNAPTENPDVTTQGSRASNSAGSVNSKKNSTEK